MSVNEAQLGALKALGVKALRLTELRTFLSALDGSIGDQALNRATIAAQVSALEEEIAEDYLAVKDL